MFVIVKSNLNTTPLYCIRMLCACQYLSLQYLLVIIQIWYIFIFVHCSRLLNFFVSTTKPRRKKHISIIARASFYMTKIYCSFFAVKIYEKNSFSLFKCNWKLLLICINSFWYWIIVSYMKHTCIFTNCKKCEMGRCWIQQYRL